MSRNTTLQPPADPPTYLTIKEVCEKLRISRWTVGRRIAAGELEAIKGDGPQGRVRISRASLERYIARRRITVTESE